LLLIALFFLWGAANNLNDVLIQQFKKAFLLSDLQSGLVQSFFYIGYFSFALPAALTSMRFSYRVSIICGLLLFTCGSLLFLPAAAMFSYPAFLFALLVIGAGLAFLETAANPYVTELGSPAEAAWRLNFAASFNPLGSIAGVAIGRSFIFGDSEFTADEMAAMEPRAIDLYHQSEVNRVKMPYLAVACASLVLVAMICAFWSKFPTNPGPAKHVRCGDVLALLRKLSGIRTYTTGVIAQFLYVGAQVGIWSFTIRYAQTHVPGTTEQEAADYLLASLAVFIAGRFATTGLIKLNVLKVHTILGAYAITASALSIVAMLSRSRLGLYCIVATSFFMSSMFPTIFAVALASLQKDDVKLASALLVMAIVGGAVITLVMGVLSDVFGIAVAFIAPAACFVGVALFAFCVAGSAPSDSSNKVELNVTHCQSTAGRGNEPNGGAGEGGDAGVVAAASQQQLFAL
jgi:FHS family L-fucose permease-like MFS transporter